MKVIEVYKAMDKSGREVLKARLNDGTEGVIQYIKNQRTVAGIIVSDSEINDAYNSYERSQG